MNVRSAATAALLLGFLFVSAAPATDEGMYPISERR